jgi:hypothetical protein
MWIRSCIILHNLILQIEAENFDPGWCNELQRAWELREGAERKHREEKLCLDDDGSEDELDLQHAHRQVMTDRQRFCRRVMNSLFDSPTSGAVRCT